MIIFKKMKESVFIKIDVEGDEMAVLQGAYKLLSSNHELKIVTACYHKHDDEIELKKHLETFNFDCSYKGNHNQSNDLNLIL
jgi:Methyltransferase FkbM domain